MASWTYLDGHWQAGNPPILGPMSHAMWLGSLVFDGARAFDGATPDLGLHAARVIHSAHAMGLAPMLSAGEIRDIAEDGIGHFPYGSALYIRPMFWGEEGHVAVDPGSTRFALAVYDSPLPPGIGITACLSRFRRPSSEMAPTDAKAACHYPQSGRALADARGRGFDNAVMLDPLGDVAEFATANLFVVKDGAVRTPAANGTFLNGITRRRVIGLLRDVGIPVEETRIGVPDLDSADEIFSTGNYAKVQAVTRFGSRVLAPGPVYRRARALYWDWAASTLR
jgi:branched-chain amino acid aminotransferase